MVIIMINYLLRSDAVYTVTGMVVVRKVMSLSGSRHIRAVLWRNVDMILSISEARRFIPVTLPLTYPLMVRIIGKI